MAPVVPLPRRRTCGNRRISEVWSWNFDAEFGELLAAVSACGEGAILALDTEFPGFLREEPPSASKAIRYEYLRENCDFLRPIQLGIAVCTRDGVLFGTWSFNLCFDMAVHLHTQASVTFLSAAGLDFPRHAAEGIDPAVIGRRIASSQLVGRSGCQPRWVTFAGWYDFGYMIRLLTGWNLPVTLSEYNVMLEAFFPRRYELRDVLPRGSLDSLARDHGVVRCGLPHTAGSDALATLELFLQAEMIDGFREKLLRAPTPAGHGHIASHQHLPSTFGRAPGSWPTEVELAGGFSRKVVEASPVHYPPGTFHTPMQWDEDHLGLIEAVGLVEDRILGDPHGLFFGQAEDPVLEEVSRSMGLSGLSGWDHRPWHDFGGGGCGGWPSPAHPHMHQQFMQNVPPHMPMHHLQPLHMM